MPRKRVSKGQIIMKKHEKLPKVAAEMAVGFTDQDFVEKFKELFPKEWANIEKRYREHEEVNKGKSHPMAPPRKYLLNAARKYIQEAREKHKLESD